MPRTVGPRAKILECRAQNECRVNAPSIATPLIIRISITRCRTFLLLKGIISFHYHYKATSKPISVRKQDIKETYKPVK